MKCIKSNSKDLALLQKNLFQINSVLYIHQRIQKKSHHSFHKSTEKHKRVNKDWS